MEILYRLTLTQCDGFLLGGLMALWMRGPAKEHILRHATKVLYIPIALLVAAYFLNNGFHLRELSATSPWMSTYGFTLVDLAAAGLLLCTLQPRSMTYKIMTKWPLSRLGKYSYGFYVYHVPLAPFLHYYIWPIDGYMTPRTHYIHFVVTLIANFVIVLAITVCSYHIVELPFLSMKDRFTLKHKNPGAEHLGASVGIPNRSE
jgi:peptidoglycan/LPS O-acetylase OafA/YrhL